MRSIVVQRRSRTVTVGRPGLQGPMGPTGPMGGTARWFRDIPQMLAEPSANWSSGRTSNNYGFDGIISGWDRVMKSSDEAIGMTPSGLSVIQTDDLLAYAVRTGFSKFMEEFDSVPSMLSSDPANWSIAQCHHFSPGDGSVSVWTKTTDSTKIPNGTDILQTSGAVNPGVILVRIFSRDGDSTSGPPPSFPAITVGVPVSVQTVDALRDGFFTAPLVFILDPNTPFIFKLGSDNQDDDGVNGVLNAAGVHYDRHRTI